MDCPPVYNINHSFPRAVHCMSNALFSQTAKNEKSAEANERSAQVIQWNSIALRRTLQLFRLTCHYFIPML